MRRSRSLIRTVVVALASLAVVAGCANDRTNGATPTVPDIGDVQLVAALQPFDACDDFLSHVKSQALERVGPYGLDGGMVARSAPDAGGREDTAVSAESAPAPMGTTPATTLPATDEFGADGDATGTNNQEAGVDEADVVKVDGDRVLTVRNNELIVVTMIEGAPHLTARVDLGDEFSGDKLFVQGDRAYVMGGGHLAMPRRGGAEDIAYPSFRAGSAAIVEVALGDAPAVAGRRNIDGYLVDGRMTNGALRLVLSTPGGTGLGFVYPSDGSPAAEQRALDANREVIEQSTIDDWLPAFVDGDGRTPLLDCDHLYRPAEPSGFSMLSILTISDGLDSLTGSGVLADGQITYASTDHLYVATNNWTDAEHTDVHSFAISGSDPATYEASGRIEGHVLNQYSMSQSGEFLRIATTTSGGTGGRPIPMPMPCEPGPATDCAVTSEIAPDPALGDSQLVILRREGRALTEVGRVDGLGPGERIKSVRYTGDVGYVVTFRQTDPLYVLDLSDPAAPKQLGELKIPGFSEYLHPVGDRLLLGVGSEADEQAGRVTGAKLSLFDASDPTAPREVTTWSARDLSFMAGSDPHAFSWDAERSTAYLPFHGACFDTFGNCASYANGVLAVRVADGAITEIGRVTHRDRTPSPAPTVPETTVPETTVPETTVPETTEPGVSDDGNSTSASSAASQPVPIAPPICAPEGCEPFPGNQDPVITRAFVVGDRVITLSDAGIAAHTVDELRLTGFAAF